MYAFIITPLGNHYLNKLYCLNVYGESVAVKQV